MSGYKYRGVKVHTARELLEIAHAQADDIIAAAKIKALEEARIIHETAYDQAMALADRDYASRQEREADRAKAREAVLARVARQRLNAASFETAGGAPINIKPAHRLENVEYLISQGCSVDDALSRSGYNSMDSFKRAAYRHGRNDLIKYAQDKMVA